MRRGEDADCEAAASQALYAELQHTHPRSTVCRRLPLDFARDADHFRVAAKTYLLPPLRKGVPSLFADIKPLYVDRSKAAALGEIFEEWLKALETDGRLRGEKVAEMLGEEGFGHGIECHVVLRLGEAMSFIREHHEINR